MRRRDDDARSPASLGDDRDPRSGEDAEVMSLRALVGEAAWTQAIPAAAVLSIGTSRRTWSLESTSQSMPLSRSALTQRMAMSCAWRDWMTLITPCWLNMMLKFSSRDSPS